jgi:hypothetical protein
MNDLPLAPEPAVSGDLVLLAMLVGLFVGAVLIGLFCSSIRSSPAAMPDRSGIAPRLPVARNAPKRLSRRASKRARAALEKGDS